MGHTPTGATAALWGAVFALAFMRTAGVDAQSPPQEPRACVYRVRCIRSAAPTGRFTAFRVQGLSGLITTLHGVARCADVRVVVPDSDDEVYARVAAIDVRHDLARIVPRDFRDPCTAGLRPSTRADDTPLNWERIVWWGFPYGAEVPISGRGTIREPYGSTTSLSGYIPPEIRSRLEARGSPSPEITIIPLEANLSPGLSGAPILLERPNAGYEVIGVGDGGLAGGATALVWAIPSGALQSLQNNATDIDQQLRRIPPNTDDLFSYNTEEDEHAHERARLFVLGARASADYETDGALGFGGSIYGGLWWDVCDTCAHSFMLRVEASAAAVATFGSYVMPDGSRRQRRDAYTLTPMAEVAVGMHFGRRSSWSVSVDAGAAAGWETTQGSLVVWFPLTTRLRGDRFFAELRPMLVRRRSHDVRMTGFLEQLAPAEYVWSPTVQGGFGVLF